MTWIADVFASAELSITVSGSVDPLEGGLLWVYPGSSTCSVSGLRAFSDAMMIKSRDCTDVWQGDWTSLVVSDRNQHKWENDANPAVDRATYSRE